MLLRTRIVLIFGIAALVLLAAVLVPLWTVQGLSEQALDEARQTELEAAWSAALSDAATPTQLVAAQLVADPALAEAIRRDDAAGANRILAAAQLHAGLVRVDVLAGEGRVFASSAGYAADSPLLDTANLRTRLQLDPWLEGIEAGPDGKMLLVVTTGLQAGQLLSVAARAEPVLQALARDGARDGGRSVFLVDPAGRLLLATQQDAWPPVAEAMAMAGARKDMRGGGTATLQRDGRTLAALSTALSNTAGQPIATLVAVSDVTGAAQRRQLVIMASFSAAALVFATLLLALYGFTKGALDPLSEITRVIRAMAAGDAMVSADIVDRADEVGAIARAVEVFRRDIVALARTKLTETLRQAQQQVLIRREMGKLAEMLDEEARVELLADLRGIETNAGEGGSALAEGFKSMAARVVAQHGKLASLLAERTRDLEIVRVALADRAQLSRLRQELEVARHLQLSSLPQIFPPFPDRRDFEIHAAMEPAKEVGGDFYDFALIGGDRLALMIGDASGKGVSAAIFIAMGRSMVRSAVVRGASPAQALKLANGTLAVENHTMMFATVFVAVLDLATGWATYASAGHNPPYLLTPGREAGVVRALPGQPGIALGIMEDAEYDDEEIQVPAGGSLVLFTDGVTEAHDPGFAMFDEARLEAALAELSQATPEGSVAAIQGAVRRFAGGAEQADDITVLVARYLGPVAARLAPVAERLPAAREV